MQEHLHGITYPQLLSTCIDQGEREFFVSRFNGRRLDSRSILEGVVDGLGVDDSEAQSHVDSHWSLIKDKRKELIELYRRLDRAAVQQRVSSLWPACQEMFVHFPHFLIRLYEQGDWPGLDLDYLEKKVGMMEALTEPEAKFSAMIPIRIFYNQIKAYYERVSVPPRFPRLVDRLINDIVDRNGFPLEDNWTIPCVDALIRALDKGHIPISSSAIVVRYSDDVHFYTQYDEDFVAAIKKTIRNGDRYYDKTLGKFVYCDYGHWNPRGKKWIARGKAIDPAWNLVERYFKPTELRLGEYRNLGPCP